MGQNVTRRVALLGISAGSNPNADLRFTHGDGARFAPLTAELLALRPDVFVAPFDTMAIPAAASTATVPIVFAVGIDPVGYGLINSLSHPGRNATGFVAGGPELGSKALSLLKRGCARTESGRCLGRQS